MKEVEVKARVRDRAKLLAAIEAAVIIFGQPTRQEDRIYAEPLDVVDLERSREARDKPDGVGYPS